MGINVSKTRLPVSFEMEDSSDNRFKKVKIWIAHTGENLNNSYFTKEALEKMSATLPNVPIVGYIKQADKDFLGHESEIVVEKDDVKIRYAGHAYGFIPEDCNAQFELREGKEWLTAEGYIWTKFRDAIDIFDESSGVKPQSMEIEGISGAVDDIGRLVIDSAVFSALCILGDEVSPAMAGSTVEYYSKQKNNYKRELEEMIREFTAEKGESGLPKDIEEKEVEDIEVPEEPEVEVEPELEEDIETEASEEETVESDEEEAEEFSEDEEVEEEQPEAEVEPELEEEIEPELEDEGEEETQPEESEAIAEDTFSIKDGIVSLQFQVSHDEILRGLYEEVGKQDIRGWNHILSVYDNHAIVSRVTYDEDSEMRNEKLVRVNYELVDGKVTISEDEEEVFAMYLNASEKEEVEGRREHVASLETELQELKEFKEQIDNNEKEKVVSEFEEELGKEDSEELRKQFSTMSVEEVEREVALKCFTKIKSEKKEQGTLIGVNNFQGTNVKSDNGYGALNKFF